MPRLSAIFFDLDQTLIHTEPQLDPRAHGLEGATPFGPYDAWLRPSALHLLATARATNSPVFLCTMAERRYAYGLSQLFTLGFEEGNILGIEHLLLGREGVSPGSILIDDLPVVHEITIFKRKILGITPERQFQIPAFRGIAGPDEAKVPGDFSKYLRWCRAER